MTEEIVTGVLKLPKNLGLMAPEEMCQLIEKQKSKHYEMINIATEAYKAFFADIETRKDNLYHEYQNLCKERDQIEKKKGTLNLRMEAAIVAGAKEDIKKIRREREQLEADERFIGEQMEVIAAHRLVGDEELFSEVQRAYNEVAADGELLREYVGSIQKAANDRINAFRSVLQYHLNDDAVMGLPNIVKAESIRANPEEFRASLQKRIAIDEAKKQARERALIEQKTARVRGIKQITQNESADEDAPPKEIKVYKTIKDPSSGRPVRIWVDPKTGEPIEQTSSS